MSDPHAPMLQPGSRVCVCGQPDTDPCHAVSGLHRRVATMLDTYERRGNTNVPGTVTLIRDLMAELDRVQPAIAQMWQDHQCQRPDLEAIVRDLAAANPMDGEMPDAECMLCLSVVEHEPSCPWRRAVEWVRDTDQETT